MRTTKTIEIDICDRCGKEGSPRKCNLCKREICDGCFEMVHAEVERYTPLQTGLLGMRSTSITRIHFGHNGIYCIDCSQRVVKALQELGLVQRQEANNLPVMDVAS